MFRDTLLKSRLDTHLSYDLTMVPMAKAPLTCLTNIQKLVFYSFPVPIASPSFSDATARVRSEHRLLPRRQENTWTLGGAQSFLVPRRIAAFSVGRGDSMW